MNDTTQTSRLGSTSKESVLLQNAKTELTPAVKRAARVAIHAGQAMLDSTFLDAGEQPDGQEVGAVDDRMKDTQGTSRPTSTIHEEDWCGPS